MRKRLLGPEELLRVRDLRQVGASWLRIQKETGIPRRVAQRSYEEMGTGIKWKRCSDCLYLPVCQLRWLINLAKLDSFVEPDSIAKICKSYRRKRSEAER